MDFYEYNEKALSTLISTHGLDDIDAALVSQLFGLVGETGEVAEKFKKLTRDKHGKISGEDKKEILKELGDVLWYINSISNLLGSSIEEVARINLAKVLSRKQRNKTTGSGDNR